MAHLNRFTPKKSFTLIIALATLLSTTCVWAQNPTDLNESTAPTSFTEVLTVTPDNESGSLLTPNRMGLAMNKGAAKVSGSWSGHTVSAVYHYENDVLELGFVSQVINELLPGRMKMEFKARPDSGNALVLFSVGL